MKRIVSAASVAAAIMIAAAVVVVAEESGKVITPFNGKDLSGWKFRGDEKKSMWVVGTVKLDPDDPKKVVAESGGTDMIDKARGIDIYTEQEFGDCTVACDVFVPKGSNSGIYLMGRYELQVCDSYGKEKDFGPGDMGGIYSTAAPKDPKYLKPGEWNTFEIVFQAPKFDADGKKTANAKFVKVVLNGATIHQNVEAPKPTGGELGKEVAKGPLMFQGDHGPIAYRNIKITLP
jgi:hypothetical protein